MFYSFIQKSVVIIFNTQKTHKIFPMQERYNMITLNNFTRITPYKFQNKTVKITLQMTMI